MAAMAGHTANGEDGVTSHQRIAMTVHGAMHRQAGFAYLVVLLFLAAFGAISAGVVVAGSAMARRDAEKELLFVGGQFRDAIRHYYEAGVGGRRYPENLEELMRDPRFAGVRRHLRRIYRDPLTGHSDWGLVLAPEGVGIIGMYSKATGTHLKVDGFPDEFESFRGAKTYSEWVFTYAPQVSGVGSPSSTVPGMPRSATPGSTPGLAGPNLDPSTPPVLLPGNASVTRPIDRPGP